MTYIEPAFDRAGRAHVIFSLRLTAPWLWLEANPNGTVALPFRAQRFWNSVSKSKGNKVDCTVWLPMRQSIRRLSDIGIRIEEAKFVHQVTAVFKLPAS
jgi:hypothetical protein